MSQSRVKDVVAHWHKLIENFETSTKDFYGRFVARWYAQSLGLFAYVSPNIYSDTFLNDLHTGLGAGGAGSNSSNNMQRLGIDATLNATPLGVPVTLENQFMANRESNPTGFGNEFRWRGGFHQLNWLKSKETVAYARYDWISGDRIDDRPNGGRAFAEPKDWDYVLGVQHLLYQNIKLVGEFRHHQFTDQTSSASIRDDGGTVRIMFGF